MFFVISPIKLVRFWRNLVHSFLNELLQNHMNFSHLTWVMSLHYLVKLQMLITEVLPLSCWRKNLRTFFALPVASKFESSWLQSVENIGKENVQNTRHWSRRTETATENGVGQAGLLSIAPDQWRVFCASSLAIVPHAVINWIQTWRIWIHSWGGIDFGVTFSDDQRQHVRDEHFRLHKVV